MMKKTVFLRRLTALAAAALLFLSQPAALAAYETLEYGSRGAEVMELQKALLSLGFNPNGTDGKFGSGTRTAVKAYQKSRGLTADGKAGNITLSLLYSEVNGGASSGASSGSSSAGEVTSTNPNTLKYGSSGSRVSELQTSLKKLGYYTGSVDGKFGAGTKRAVMAFQSANGLTPDGLAGSQTLAMIAAKVQQAQSGSSSSSNNSSTGSSSSSSSSSGDFTRTLRRGYTGADVVKVQNRLTELGYYSKEVDGVYGLGSMAAVKAFQEKNGLYADGLAGAKTFEKLFSSSAVAAGSSSSSNSSSSGSSSSSSSSASYTRLEEGDKGDEVRAMQRALKSLNYPVEADGSFGPATTAAVKLFQGANSLSADGVAGQATLSLLYSGKARAYTGSGTSSGSSSSGSTSSGKVSSSAGASAMGSFTGRNGERIQLLHWFNEVKPSLRTGQNLKVYEPDSGISFTLYVMSRGRHADVEPLTAEDTEKMMNAWGGKEDWTPKDVYIKLPDGRWTLATMHNVAHGSQTIGNNNYDGQNCVHFLRDMSECEANDPNYGVQNQNALRKAWKNATGVAVD